jgi:hypothetical protein
MRKKTRSYSAEFKLNAVNRMAQAITISGLGKKLDWQYGAQRKSRGKTIAAHHQSNVDPVTDLEISAKSIKVRSSVLGLLLLLTSMGFFCLYLRYVYPIQEVTYGQQDLPPTSPSK